MQELTRRLQRLEKKQVKSWNKDRAWQVKRLQDAVAGRLNDRGFIGKNGAGKLAVNTDSPTERIFTEHARSAGWEISKRGWPDFIMWKDGEIACVEVKKDLDRLRDNQLSVLEALASHGVPCFTWRPIEGFVRI
jgi:VRR-NUC domain